MIEPILSTSLACPVGASTSDCILLAHGEGGRLMRKLLRQRIAPLLRKCNAWEDAAACPMPDGEVAITTDSYVVSPLFFPGGDIGSLAVYGTVNDLAVSGAEPLYVTLALILEEGLPFEVLDRVLQSIAAATDRCGVSVVAGDTKVVPRGAADKLFINTTGVGHFRRGPRLGCSTIQAGDVLLVSGPIGHHGISVLAARENLNLKPEPRSDSRPLHRTCRALHEALGSELHAMRDATRGGVSAVLHEWSEASNTTMKLSESKIPVSPDVRGACELLGLDPLYVANEGTFVAAVSAKAADRAIEVLRAVPESVDAQVVGEVVELLSSPVVIERLLGVLHPVDEPSGAPLPRIC